MSWCLWRCSFRTAARRLLIGVFTFSVIMGWSMIGCIPPAQSQLPSLPTSAGNRSFNPPDGVSRHGEYETAWVESPLDGKTLFEIASPTILNRDKVPEGMLPVEVRVQEVNERLWRVLNRIYFAQGRPVAQTMTIARLNNRPVIEISNDRSSRSIRLVTVTEPDADWNGKTLDELAQEWQTILQDEITRLKQLATPGEISRRIGLAFQILVGLLIASAVIWFLRRILARRQCILEARYQEQLAALAEAEAQKLQPIASSETASSETVEEEAEAREITNLQSQFLAILQHRFSVKRQLDIDKFLKWALLWIFILMWYVGTARIMSIVPLLMRWSLYIWATPLAMLVIWFGISLAIRISKSLIDHVMYSWKNTPLLAFGEAQRIALRTATVSEALKGFVTVVLVVIGIVWTLSLLNIPTSSILAGGAVIGLAISFGSQSLIKDLVNGCLILVEDQFAVGDVIQVGDKDGLVENLNLRVTQLRNDEGQLITIPNSNITDVRNLTRLWSRVDFSIVVAYKNDPKQVLDVLRQVCQQLYSEPEWRARLPEPPKVLGLDDLSQAGMLVRVWIKTAPMEQWNVGREFRLRVKQAFEANSIHINDL